MEDENLISEEISRTTLDIERVLNGKNVFPEYYEAAASIARPRHFPSPVNDPDWIGSTTDWFVESRIALEVGPGRGEFAEAVVKKTGKLEKYYIIDMSQGMLTLVKKRIQTVGSKVESIFIHADVDSDHLLDIPDHSIDRIIMINAFQDINPLTALRVFRRILSQEGLFRANVISREIREKFSDDNDLFDGERGYFYLTRYPAAENNKGIEPIGYINTKDGDKVPFYRMLRSYYRTEIDEIFNECGFEIISANPLILPKDVWMNSAAAQDKGLANIRRMELMDKFGGYPGSIEIIAKPLINKLN